MCRWPPHDVKTIFKPSSRVSCTRSTPIVGPTGMCPYVRTESELSEFITAVLPELSSPATKTST